MEHKEKKLKGSIRPISLPIQTEITRQMKKCVCKIHKNGENGTGFFAQIPCKESNIKVLITSNHVLNANDIHEHKLITFSINNDILNFKIGKERKKYTSEKYDTTIIEIIETDKLENVIEYLEIDDINLKTIKENDKQLSNEYFNNLYKNESLYILNYLGGKDIVISYGFFAKIQESEIYHKCSTDDGSSGAPILSLEDNKIIGVHFGSLKNEIKFNLGTLIAYPIIEFNMQNIQNKAGNIQLTDKINRYKNLDYFTTTDIQDDNKEITRLFQQESFNHIDDDEVIENETIAKFLLEVALISRSAYNFSNVLFINMFNEFSKFNQKEKNISTLKYDEELRKEFSSWVKQYEKGTQGKQKYKNYFNSFKCKENYDKEDYISALYSQLTILYFHCELSFPIVGVDFHLNSEESFNHEKMIDFINKGNNRKVNFVILPSLFSNGNFLEYGKFWVFTYKKDTFKFDKLRFENLVNKQEKYNSNYSKNNCCKSNIYYNSNKSKIK